MSKKFRITCPTCGKTVIKSGNSKRPPIYCSRECYFASTSRKQRSDKGNQKVSRITTYCKECGKELHVKQSVLDAGRGKFCSTSCSARYYGKRRPSCNPKANKRIKLICEVCGQEFEVKPYRIKQNPKYCSHECANKIKGSIHPHSKEKVRKSCVVCNTTVYVHPCRADSFKCCSHECLCRYALSKLIARKDPTSIEQLLLDELDKHPISYDFQFDIGKWSIDIALPKYKVAIEADGDYWHSLPARRKKDEEKDEWLINRGWFVFRFKGSEIRESPSDCINKILTYIDNL